MNGGFFSRLTIQSLQSCDSHPFSSCRSSQASTWQTATPQHAGLLSKLKLVPMVRLGHHERVFPLNRFASFKSFEAAARSSENRTGKQRWRRCLGSLLRPARIGPEGRNGRRLGGLNLGGSMEPVFNASTLVEIAVEKGAVYVLMPISVSKQLNDLSDDVLTKSRYFITVIRGLR